MSKKKIIVLSDHALSPSGVGVQTKHLIEGLIKTGKYSFRQLGAAMKHRNYSTVAVNEDFIIKPVDGFGNPELIRKIIITEKPDAFLIFSDPRFFKWFFNIEDEIHQTCPILWWHVWDNKPTPKFNYPLYEATDAINCHSYLTYEMCKEDFPEKTSFIPHSVPQDVYYPLEEDKVSQHKEFILKDRKDFFTVIWVNRNARRKRPGDLLYSWKLFLDKLDKKDAVLILHTNPYDEEGQNLIDVAKELDILKNVMFSDRHVTFEELNVLYNISDCAINISLAEGFGLTTLEAMQVGKPIIATKTGGLTRQVVNFNTGEENGVALEPDLKTMVGSQSVPYIFEDYVSQDKIADALKKIYDMDSIKRKELGNKARKYVLENFNYENTIKEWDSSLEKTINNWQKLRKNYTIKTF